MVVGRAMQHGFGRMMSMGAFGTEIIYAFVVIACSLIIYFATRELDEISSYKGIRYFRYSFLFFAIAYFFRSFIKFIIYYFNVTGIFEVSPMRLNPFIGQISLFIFIYFSSLAIFYLVYSIMKWEKRIYLFHFLSLFIGLIILSRDVRVYLSIHFLLIIFIFFVVYSAYRDAKSRKGKHNFYAIYILLFVFWILNVIDILIPRYLQNFQIFIYICSISIFLTILYKVSRKLGEI